ncbi:MAG: FtsX-like permease family protein [Elusimicrobiota bacterium]|mgnify:CR=1 FL=1
MELPFLLLAWRNLWRNKRRSLLTIFSVAFGLAAVMFGQSLLTSFQRQMVDKSTGVMVGHLQIQAREAKDRKVPLPLLEGGEAHKALLLSDPRVEAAGLRLLFTGLAYSAAGSRGVLVVGVEPETEPKLSIMPGYLRSGRYVEKARDIVMGDKLAGHLDLRLGEKAVLMAQGPDGSMNSELFRLSGIYHSGSDAFDAQIVYVPLPSAQLLRGRPGMISHAVARLKDSQAAFRTARDLSARFSDPVAALLTYEDVGSEVVGIKKFEDALWAVLMTVIFSIVGLGILNTVSMSFFERIREFGVLRALGARPAFVMKLLAAESVLMGTLGTALGLTLGWSLISFFRARGLALPVGDALSYFMPFDDIIYLRPVWESHAKAAALAFAVSVAAAAAPGLRASRLVVHRALRHV